MERQTNNMQKKKKAYIHRWTGDSGTETGEVGGVANIRGVKWRTSLEH